MSDLHDPRRSERVIRLGMQEILGVEDTNILMGADGAGTEDGSFSASKLRHVLAALEQQYGAAGGRGLAQRIGRACFQYGLREYGDALGVTSTSFRLLPFPYKLKTFAGKLAEMFNGISESCIRLEEGEGKLQWHMQPCAFCQDRHAEESICLLPVGLAEEALYWLSGGKMFSV